jgi:eukaryotic-like serine/threonine-protein kinase
MDERTARLRALVVEAAARRGAERDAFLAEAGAGDPGLAEEARELLALAESSGGDLPRLELPADLARPVRWEARAGDRIGSFELVALLGVGGMGQVWEAEQSAPRRRVALKLVHADRFGTQALARFEREAQLLARLRHPSIAQVIESGVEEIEGRRRPWYALELVENALSLLQHARGLPLRRRIELLAEVCDAIHHAHLRGIVHRDLKSANVLVDGAGRPRVIDFGIARELDTAERPALTHSGELLGTLGSMSPEQLRGDPSGVDARTDVWGLGVLGYELACGSPPFPAQGLALVELARTIEQDPPRPPSALDPEIDRDLEVVLLHALAKEPQRRYASADALRVDLENWLAGRPVNARPATTLYQLRKYARRHRAASAALAALVIVSLSAAAISAHLGFKALAAERVSARRFDELRGLARSVLFELHDSIERLPGATEARELLASKALEYLDLLERDAQGDPSLLAEIGEGRLRLGEVLGAPSHASLGDREGARRELERVIALDARVSAEHPQHDLHLLGARAKLMLASIERAAGNFERAADFARQGAEQATARVASGRGDALAERLALTGQILSAKVLARTGRAEDALERLQASLGQCEALAAKYPEWKEPRRDQMLLQVDVATLLQQRAQAGQALPLLESAHGLAQERCDSAPRDRQALADLAMVLERRGDALASLQRPSEALEDLERAVEIERELLAVDPRDASAIDSLSTSCERLGAARSAASDFEGALAAHQESLELCERRLGLSPDGFDERIAVAIEGQYVANALRKLGRHSESRVALERAAEALEPLERLHPGSVEVPRQLGTLHGLMGEEASTRGDFAAAFLHFDEAARQIDRAIAQDPGHALTRRMVMVVLSNRGVAHRRAAESTQGPERAAQLAAAIDAFECMLREFEAQRGEGVLLPGDEQASSAVRADLAACREARERTASQ